MESKPKLKVELSAMDKIIEMIGWMILLIIWILTLLNFTKMPDTIPIHFNFSGQADNFGSKWTILTFPVFGTVLYVGLTILNKFPHIFNYPTKITPENALQKYIIATRMIRFLKLGLMLIFSIITYLMIYTIDGKSAGLGVWFLPFSLGIIFIPMLYFLIKSFRNK